MMIFYSFIRFVYGKLHVFVHIIIIVTFVITAEIFGTPDYGPIIGGYLGAIFLCAAFDAVGLFSSSITKNQIIAFAVAMGICLAFTFIDMFLILLPDGIVKYISFFSASIHFESNCISKFDVGIVALFAIYWFVVCKMLLTVGQGCAKMTLYAASLLLIFLVIDVNRKSISYEKWQYGCGEPG